MTEIAAATHAKAMFLFKAKSIDQNLLIRMLPEPDFRRLHADWETIARQMVAILHLSYGRAPENASAIALVERLREISAEFRG